MLLGSDTCYCDILSVAKAKGNDMGNDMGNMVNDMDNMGNDIGDMGNMVNDMDGILPKAIHCKIAEIRDTDIVHGDTSITI